MFPYSQPLEQWINFYTFGVLPVDGNRYTASGIFSIFNTNYRMENILCVCFLTQSYPALTDIQTSSVATYCILPIYLGVLLTVCLLSCSYNHGHDLTIVSGIEISSVTFPGKVVRCGETLIDTIFPQFPRLHERREM